MNYHFRNLVFEGGGVKGIAYLGALQILEKKGILANIQRVGGTSAGAINAVLLALGFTHDEQTNILKALDFNKFMDGSWGFGLDTWRLLNEYGWYKGDFFANWVGELVARKLGSPSATFQDLRNKGFRDLYICGTNLSTENGEVFSLESTPTMSLVEALRISMSIPLFFRAVKRLGNIYVDGGVLNNYPVKLFDELKYIAPEKQAVHAVYTDYYKEKSALRRVNEPNASPLVYNRETLGFRLDSKSEIARYRDGSAPEATAIKNFFSFGKALIGTLLDSQDQQHLHSDDWQRTIYIDTLGVGTTQFNISQEMKDKLIGSGSTYTNSYFDWYDKAESAPANKPSVTALPRPA